MLSATCTVLPVPNFWFLTLYFQCFLPPVRYLQYRNSSILHCISNANAFYHLYNTSSTVLLLSYTVILVSYTVFLMLMLSTTCTILPVQYFCYLTLYFFRFGYVSNQINMEATDLVLSYKC